jgi:hypothetical protein
VKLPPFDTIQAGGFVNDGRVCGIMEVSRSIGDAALKSKGVSSVPDTTRIALSQVKNTFASDRCAHRSVAHMRGNFCVFKWLFFMLQ